VQKNSLGNDEWMAAALLCRKPKHLFLLQMVLQAGQDSPRHFHLTCIEVFHIVTSRVLTSATKAELSCLAGDSAVSTAEFWLYTS